MTISGKTICKENILYLHWYQMKHDGCVICRKPEKRCITLRAQVISLPNWQQKKSSHSQYGPWSRCTLPIMIQSLPWTMLWLFSRFNPTISLRSVSRWQSSEQESFFSQQILFAGSLFLLSRPIWEEPPGRSSWQIKISTWDGDRCGPRQTGWGAITKRFYWSFFFTSI